MKKLTVSSALCISSRSTLSARKAGVASVFSARHRAGKPNLKYIILCIYAMKLRRVSGIVFCKDGKILMQDRHNIMKWGEEWGFFGGAIEAGETPEQALVREIKEELCYDLANYEYIGTCSGPLAEMMVEVNMYAAPLPDLSEFDQKEGCGMKLFTVDEARELKIVDVDLKVLDMVEGFFMNR